MASFSNVSTYLLLWLVTYVTDKTIVARLPAGIVDSVEENCENNSYCTTEGTHYNGSMLPKVCCKPCTCNAECSNLGNCCPDNLGKKIDITFKTSCRPGFYQRHTSMFFNEGSNVVNAVRYWMVTTCLDGSTCDLHSLNDANATLDDVSPVYSADYNAMFQDRRCAECNDITNTNRWELEAAQCIGVSPTEFAFMTENLDLKLEEWQVSKQQLLSLLIDYCVLVALPPDDETFQRIRCVLEDGIQYVNRCNESGLWGTYNETTEKFCEDPNGWFPVHYDAVIYKNVYCILCNTIHFNKNKLIEANADPNGPICKNGRALSLNNVLNSLGPTFSLNLLTETKNETERPDGHCAVHKIFDSFYGKCRQLYCPPLTVAVNGSCDTREEVQSVVYELAVLFLPISRLSFSPRFIYTIDVSHFEDTLLAISNSYLPGRSFFIRASQNQMFVETNTWLVIALSTHFFVETSTDGDITIYDWYKSLQRLFFEEVVIQIHSLNNLECILKPLTQRGLKNALHSYDIIGPSSYQILFFLSQLELSRDIFGPTEHVVTIENDKPFPYIIMDQLEYCELASKFSITVISATFVKDSCPLLHNTFLHTSSNDSQVLVQLEVFEKLVDKSKFVPYITKNPAPGLVSFVTSCISMACIAVAFCLNCWLDRMRNAPMLVFGIGLGNLFIAQGLFQFGSEWVDYKLLCQTVALGVHYFWLAVVFSFNAFCSLVAWNVQRTNTPPLRSKELVISIIYVFGLPLILVLINIIYSANLPNPNNRSVGYGSTKCHIDSALMRYLLFDGPIFLTVIFNCIIYASIVHKIKSISVQSTVVKNGARYASVYFQLLLMTGIMWMFDLINEYVQSEVITYIFIVLIGGQGVMILLFFTCNCVFYQKLNGVCLASETNKK